MHIENLRVGDWVTGIIDKRDLSQSWSPFGGPQPMQFDGAPHRVVALSPPFVAVERIDGERGTIDLRVIELTKLSKSFVRALSNQKIKRRKKRRQKPDERACPRCGERMVQRHFKGDNRWHIYCPACDTDFGPVVEEAPV